MSNRSLEGSSPKNFRTRSVVAAEAFGRGQVGLDLLDLVFGNRRLGGRQLPAIAPGEEGRGFGQATPSIAAPAT